MARVISRRLPLVALVISLGLFGCGGQKSSTDDAYYARREQQAAAPPAQDGKPAAEPAAAAGGEKADAATPAPERKIIFTAHLDVVVKDLNEAWAAAEKLLAENKGYVAKSEVRSDTGSRRTGTYTLRVPVDRFTAVLNKLKELGIPERDATDSQDVTEEYVDLQSRLTTLRKEEESLRKLLDKAASLAEQAPIRKELTAIRLDIEKSEGRVKYLSALSALSTIHLTLKEIKDYKPPTTPTFGERVGRTFGGSWDALVTFGEGVALAAVALVPWLPLIIPAVLLGVVLIRRSRRQAAEHARVKVESRLRRRRPDDPGPTSEDVPPPAG